jgi:hypothetical protein
MYLKLKQQFAVIWALSSALQHSCGLSVVLESQPWW